MNLKDKKEMKKDQRIEKIKLGVVIDQKEYVHTIILKEGLQITE